MKVKGFALPDFDTWVRNNYCAKAKLGEYYCVVEASCWHSDETVYACAVATNPIPNNIYVDAIYSSHYVHVHAMVGADDQLRLWYEGMRCDLQRKWTQYIRKTYLEE